MNGYRRIEPAFCRGCGTPWAPGADACPSCGEALLRERPAGGDPRALPKLRAVLVVSALLIAVRWGSALAADTHLMSERWVAITCAALALALGTARWWYPAGTPSPRARPRAIAWLAAAFVGLALPLAYGLAIGMPDDGLPLLTAEATLWWSDMAWWWIALAFGGIALEEAFFRGVFFDGVAAIGGPRNAAIASALLFALMFLDPVLALLGGLAAILRAWSGSLGPALALRLVAAATWLSWCWLVL